MDDSELLTSQQGHPFTDVPGDAGRSLPATYISTGAHRQTEVTSEARAGSRLRTAFTASLCLSGEASNLQAYESSCLYKIPTSKVHECV